MANYSKSTIILSVAALLVSLVLVHVAESRVLPEFGSAHSKPAVGLVCTDAYGAAAGDTCFSIANTFNLTTDTFNLFNPNLDCHKIFVGEWICVDGVLA